MATNVGFQLPTWAMLSAEQETIVNMPTTKDYVVQGSPGTGKTVMALYRAARIAQRDDCDVTILVYNRPLMMYMQTATDGSQVAVGCDKAATIAKGVVIDFGKVKAEFE